MMFSRNYIILEVLYGYFIFKGLQFHFTTKRLTYIQICEDILWKVKLNIEISSNSIYYYIVWNNILKSLKEGKMYINYKKLWKLLIDKKMNKSNLKELTKMSSSTLSKLTKDKYVSMEVLVRICKSLNCQLSDICEVELENGKAI